jgi:hypothetical protein
MPQSKSESGKLGHYQMLRRSAALPMHHSRAPLAPLVIGAS